MYVKSFEYTKNGEIIRCPYVHIDNFLPAEICDILIDYFDTHIDRKIAESIQDYFKGRTIWYSRIQSDHPAKEVMQKTRDMIIAVIKEAFREEQICNDSIQLVKWPQDLSMEPHLDNQYNNGEPNGTPWRDYAAVLYLNDDYEEGEFHFAQAEPEVFIKPKKGTLLCFGGGEDYMHGVKACKNKDRYTMPGWYTRDMSKREAEISFPERPENRFFSGNFR